MTRKVCTSNLAFSHGYLIIPLESIAVRAECSLLSSSDSDCCALFLQYPPCYKDISFWISDSFTENNLCELVRGIAGDLVEEVWLTNNIYVCVCVCVCVCNHWITACICNHTWVHLWTLIDRFIGCDISWQANSDKNSNRNAYIAYTVIFSVVICFHLDQECFIISQ